MELSKNENILSRLTGPFVQKKICAWDKCHFGRVTGTASLIYKLFLLFFGCQPALTELILLTDFTYL